MQAVIDRFEGEYAVLLVGEDEKQQLDIAKEFLPEEAQEGDYLKISFEIDQESRKGREQRVGDLLEKLKNRD